MVHPAGRPRLIVMVKHEDRRGCQQPGPRTIFGKQGSRTLLGLVALPNCRTAELALAKNSDQVQAAATIPATVGIKNS